MLIPWLGGTLNWRALRRPWVWGLAIFAVALLVSCLTSLAPSTSWRYFRKEMLFYWVVFLGIVLGASSFRELRRLIFILVMTGLVACAMSIATYYHFVHGADEVTRLSWLDEKTVVGSKVYLEPERLANQVCTATGPR